MKIKDKNDEFANYTSLSNIIDELDLSPLATAMYFHFKRWANAEFKQISVKKMMAKFKVGSPAISKAKQELIDNDLILVNETGRALGIPDEIEIVDIIDRNREYFRQTELLSGNGSSCYPVTGRVTNQQLDPLLSGNGTKDESKSTESKSTENIIQEKINKVLEVFKYWKIVCNHGKAKYSDDKKRKINARLKDGFSVDDLKKAIDGCKASPNHNGTNYGTIYDSVDLIFRDASKVEYFIGIAEAINIINNGANQNETTNGNQGSKGNFNHQAQPNQEWLDRNAHLLPS